MTRDKAEKLLPIIKAYSEGKEIQVLTPSAGWVTITTPNFDDISYYRIKPKMTKEELEEKECLNEQPYNGSVLEERLRLTNQIFTLKEENSKLEKKISILLSCKDCPENKGGYICQKEYEDKCLAQKIQYIKELQEENKKWKDEWQEQVQKENNESYARTLQTIQLNKAKKIISNLYAICKDNHYPNTSVLMEQTEQFLKECE